MKKQDSRHADPEIKLSGFVVKIEHAKERANAAAKGRQRKECSLGNTVSMFDGFPFVNPHGEKSDEIHHQRVGDEKRSWAHMCKIPFRTVVAYRGI